MAESRLKAAPVLGEINLKFDRTNIVECVDIALISVATPLGGRDALAAKLVSDWALQLPTPKNTETSENLRAISLTADQFMLAFTPSETLTESTVEAALSGVAYTTVQTDAWVVLELSGPGALTTLERMCPLDLDVRAFPTGASARTMVEHLGVLIVRLEDDRFLLMSARSSAISFLHAVETSCRWTA